MPILSRERSGLRAHVTWTFARCGVAGLAALHQLGGLKCYRIKSDYTNSSSYSSARVKLGAHSGTGGGLAARWLTRVENLQCGTIPSGSCHQKKKQQLRGQISTELLSLETLRCWMKEKLAVNPKRRANSPPHGLKFKRNARHTSP